MAKKANRLSVAYGLDQGEDYDGTLTDVIFRVLNSKDEAIDTDTFDLAELPEEMKTRVSLYGLNKALSDRTSDVTNKVAKLIEMRKVFELFVSGEWKKERVVGAPVVSVEVEALAKLKEISVPEAQKALASYDKATRAQILSHKLVQGIAAQIRIERGSKATVNLDDLAF